MRNSPASFSSSRLWGGRKEDDCSAHWTSYRPLPSSDRRRGRLRGGSGQHDIAPISLSPQPKGRGHNLHEFVRVAGTKYSADAQLSKLGIRNNYAGGGVPIHFGGCILERRLVELHSPALPCCDSTQFRPIHGRRMVSRNDQPLPRN